MPDQPRTGWGLWVATAIGLFGYGGLAWLHADQGTLRDRVTPRTIVWFSVAFVGFLVALWWNRRHPLPLVWLWAIPIAFRLILLSTTPTLSDDVYRYLWDGHVAASGTNPYSHTLNAPALDSIEIPARSLANNPSLGTPYLPSAQGVFAASALVAPSEPITLQVVMTLFDLASAMLIVRLLALAGLPRNRVMLYLWNPLVILEIAHGAHLDAMMVFGALLAVYLALSKGLVWWAAPVVLGLSTLTKPLPAMLAVVLWHRWQGRARLVFGATVLGILVPFGWSAGWGLIGNSATGVFGSTRVYSGWWFNGGVSFWLDNALNRLSASWASGGAQLLTGGLMLAVLVIVWRRACSTHSSPELLGLMAVPFGAFILLTPIMHPWYMVVMLAFLPFVGRTPSPSFEHAPWLCLSATLIFSYLTYLDPLNHGEVGWVRYMEWIPVFVLLGAAAIVRDKRALSGVPGPGR